MRRRRRREKVYNVVSFTLPVPAMSHGHRGGDGVSVVEVTPRSTHSLWAHPSVPAAMARIPRGFGEAKNIYLGFVLETARCNQGSRHQHSKLGEKRSPEPLGCFKVLTWCQAGTFALVLCSLILPQMLLQLRGAPAHTQTFRRGSSTR